MARKKKAEQEVIYMRLPDTSRYMIAVNGAYSVQTIPAGSNAIKHVALEYFVPTILDYQLCRLILISW